MVNTYNIGYMTRNNETYATLNIQYAIMVNEMFNKCVKIFAIKIIFDKNQSYTDLKDVGLDLSFYKRFKNTWRMILLTKNQLKPELNRLQRMGFVIEKDYSKNDMHKLVADLI